MITGLDHLVLLARDIDVATQAYETLLGLCPAWRTDSDGVATAIFTFANTSLEIMAPSGDGPTADRVRARLDADDEGLASLAFRVRNIDAYHRRLNRLGLQPEDIANSGSTNALDDATLSWRRTRTNVEAAHGVRLFFLDMAQGRPVSQATADAPVIGLEHTVIATSDSDRAADLYGKRLGLDLKSDLTRPDGSMRLLVFGCGDSSIEVVNLPDAARGKTDRLWGLSWRVADIDAAHQRLSGAGLGVTDVRKGRRPGTRVFTVNTGTLGVPTLIIQPAT